MHISEMRRPASGDADALSGNLLVRSYLSLPHPSEFCARAARHAVHGLYASHHLSQVYTLLTTVTLTSTFNLYVEMPLVAETAGIWHWCLVTRKFTFNGWWPKTTVKTLVAHTGAIGGQAFLSTLPPSPPLPLLRPLSGAKKEFLEALVDVV
jgi:hypothetical protein